MQPGDIPTACIQKRPQLADRKCVTVCMLSLCNGRSLSSWSDADLRSQESGGDALASLWPHHTVYSFQRRVRMSLSCSTWRSLDSLMLFCEFSSVLFLAALCAEDERAAGWGGWESTRVQTLWCPGTWQPLACVFCLSVALHSLQSLRVAAVETAWRVCVALWEVLLSSVGIHPPLCEL